MDKRERGILFKPELVRAILAGRKTVTRRLIKRPATASTQVFDEACAWLQCRGRTDVAKFGPADGVQFVVRSPCYPGDRLYVKETWRPQRSRGYTITVEYSDGATRVVPVTDIPDGWHMPLAAERGRNVSPLFMPRWASRLWLDAVSVRAERLQDITEEDARAEGVENRSDLAWDGAIGIAALTREDPYAVAVRMGYRVGFAHKWDEINGERATWASNPWVWRTEFRRIER